MINQRNSYDFYEHRKIVLKRILAELVARKKK